jgi:non-ribosomal peptide synthetase component E (peptide arylation enzyme)
MQPGHAAPTLVEMRDYLAAQGLAKQKWPEHIREVQEFPRTPSGKVQKYVLRGQLRGEA